MGQMVAELTEWANRNEEDVKVVLRFGLIVGCYWTSDRRSGLWCGDWEMMILIFRDSWAGTTIWSSRSARKSRSSAWSCCRGRRPMLDQAIEQCTNLHGACSENS